MSDPKKQDTTETVAVQLHITTAIRAKLGAMAQLQRITLSEWVSAAVIEAAARMGLPDLDLFDGLASTKTDAEVG